MAWRAFPGVYPTKKNARRTRFLPSYNLTPGRDHLRSRRIHRGAPLAIAGLLRALRVVAPGRGQDGTQNDER
jgi:hypothetical protein